MTINTKAVRALADEAYSLPHNVRTYLRQCADEIDALHAALDKYGDGVDWIQRAMQAEAEIDAMKEDAERYLWGVENARWIRHAHEAYVAIPVAHDADLSCVAMRTHAIDRARKGTT
jgi:hypothetical protein